MCHLRQKWKALIPDDMPSDQCMAIFADIVGVWGEKLAKQQGGKLPLQSNRPQSNERLPYKDDDNEEEEDKLPAF